LVGAAASAAGPENASAPIARGTAKTERVILVPVIMSLSSS
jgi:hypothetical protein